MKSFFKPSLSTVLVSFFFLILLFLGLFAEVFESRSPEIDLAEIYANPIPINEIHRLKTLRLTNKNGSFLFENTDPEGALTGPWQMLEPQALRVRPEIISKIIDALNIVKVRNFFPLEPINITSFSLDNPTLTLFFTNTKDKDYEVKLGLINPIDNSAYLSLSSQDQIYQIDPLEMGLESYDLSQLVESKVFAINPDSFLSFELKNQTDTLLKIAKKDYSWIDQSGIVLNENKVKKFLSRIEEIKSYSILDRLNTDQQIAMERAMENYTYLIQLITTQGLRRYYISDLKNQISGVPGIKTGTFALSSDERNSFVLIDKNELRALMTKTSELK